jgi:hypothetical protein
VKTKLVMGIAAGAVALTIAGGAAYAGSTLFTHPAQAAAKTSQAPLADNQAPLADDQTTNPTSTPAQPGRSARAMGGQMLAAPLVRATATVTGLKPADIFTALKSGKSLAQIAQEKGKTADDVVKTARATLQSRLSQAVSSGKLTQAQADQALARFDASATKLVNSTNLGQQSGRGFDYRAQLGGRAALIAATAKVTGMQPKDIAQELKSGKSLAQIAQEKGKTADDILAQLRATGEQRLNNLLDRAKQAINTPGLGNNRANNSTAAPSK